MNTHTRQQDFGWTVDLVPAPNRLRESEEAREEAVDRVGAAADADGWMDHAIEVIMRLALARPEFTADDIWDAGLEPPREKRALGAALTALRRRGAIEPTAAFKTTVRASRHAAPIRVWRSKLKD